MSARAASCHNDRPRIATGVDLPPNVRPIVPASHCPRSPARGESRWPLGGRSGLAGWEAGHPLAGQTIGVSLGSAVIANVGHTGGSATSIVAFFGAPPPAAASLNNTVRFLHYVSTPLPRTLRVPCAGTGKVYFVPLPMDPTSSQPAIVDVNYEGQP